jgi:hypothetical protein
MRTNTLQSLILSILVLCLLATGVQADAAPPTPRASVAPFSAQAVTPIVRNTMIKALGYPALGAVVGGTAGYIGGKLLLKTIAGEAAKKWLPAILARGTGTILGAVGAALLVNYLFDRSREARVRRVSAAHRTPAEAHREQVTDSLPRDPAEHGTPGFEDINLDEEFPH